MKLIILLTFFLNLLHLGYAQDQVVSLENELAIKPVSAPALLYQRYVINQTHHLAPLADQIRAWDRSDSNIAKWNFRDNGMYDYYQNDERQEYIKKQFTRFITRQTKEPLKHQLGTLRNRFDMDEEIIVRQDISADDSTIYDSYAYNEYLEEKNEGNQSKTVDPSDKELKVFSNYRLTFKPRIFQGYALVEYKNKYSNLNTMVAVNGDVEFNWSQGIKKLGLYTLANYRLNDGRFLASVDKRLGRVFTLRVSSQREPTGSFTSTNTIVSLVFRETF